MSHLSLALGRNIRKSRKSVGLSQEAFALKAKVDRSYMGRIERGETNITVEMLFQLADVLGVGPEVLLPRTNEVDESPPKR
ncbi:helix-turn-helix domain-containing protein [Alteromonas oceani]|uniref:Helix-turn-helix domain-containing protein n=1 Tax=Alteromonas oceani TaxID=2071609 RepID=A0ABV7K2D3_9ALTE|nr:helix-turn-helix transcriptional regulator [Alteromonas oceani]